MSTNKISAFFSVVLLLRLVWGHPRNLAWTGGPLHSECEHSADFLTHTGHYVRENVVAIKALTLRDDIYVVTPSGGKGVDEAETDPFGVMMKFKVPSSRWKRGVLASLWLVVRGRKGVELQAFPDQRSHRSGDCDAVQNAVDAVADHKGNLWILDTGMVETLESPRCTCRPKVAVVSSRQKRISKLVEIAAEPTSLLQTMVVEYNFGSKPFVYISDASRGAILVHDTSSGAQWTVAACAPSPGLQMAMVKRGLSHHVMVLIRLHSRGLLEMDTAALRRQNSMSALRVFGEHTKPVVLLGFDHHHVYLRHVECADVLSWDARDPYNATELLDVHSPGPGLTPTSVTADPWKNVLLVLDSNYGDTVARNKPTYHRITFIGQL